MIIGSRDTNIVGPLKIEGNLLTQSAIQKPRIITHGVTIKVYVRVKLSAL